MGDGLPRELQVFRIERHNGLRKADGCKRRRKNGSDQEQGCRRDEGNDRAPAYLPLGKTEHRFADAGAGIGYDLREGLPRGLRFRKHGKNVRKGGVDRALRLAAYKERIQQLPCVDLVFALEAGVERLIFFVEQIGIFIPHFRPPRKKDCRCTAQGRAIVW